MDSPYPSEPIFQSYHPAGNGTWYSTFYIANLELVPGRMLTGAELWQRRRFPVQLCWQGATTKAHFSECTGSLICECAAASVLCAELDGLDVLPAEVLPRSKASSCYTYKGPPVCVLEPTLYLPWNPVRWTLEGDSEVDNYRLVGIETPPVTHYAGSVDRPVTVTSPPRIPGHGVLVTLDEVRGHDIFRYGTGVTFGFTLHAVETIRRLKLRGIAFVEVGEVVNAQE